MLPLLAYQGLAGEPQKAAGERLGQESTSPPRTAAAAAAVLAQAAHLSPNPLQAVAVLPSKLRASFLERTPAGGSIAVAAPTEQAAPPAVAPLAPASPCTEGEAAEDVAPRQEHSSAAAELEPEQAPEEAAEEGAVADGTAAPVPAAPVPAPADEEPCAWGVPSSKPQVGGSRKRPVPGSTSRLRWRDDAGSHGVS